MAWIYAADDTITWLTSDWSSAVPIDYLPYGSSWEELWWGFFVGYMVKDLLQVRHKTCGDFWAPYEIGQNYAEMAPCIAHMVEAGVAIVV